MNMKSSFAWLLTSAYAVSAFVAHGAIEYTATKDGMVNQPATIDGANASGLTGGIKVTPSSGNDPGYTTPFTTVCLDVNGALVLTTPQNFAAVSFPDATLLGLNPPWGNNGGNGSSSAQAGIALNNAAYLMYSSGAVLTSGDAAARAAFQLAIWEVLYDTGLGFDLDSGRFTGGEGAVKLAAQGFLASVPSVGNTPQFSGTILVPVLADGSWDYSKQELLIDPGSITPAPEASTILAGFAGVAVLLTRTWHAHRRKAAQKGA
jgi:hypothetical protein